MGTNIAPTTTPGVKAITGAIARMNRKSIRTKSDKVLFGVECDYYEQDSKGNWHSHTDQHWDNGHDDHD